jgi:hypothetical protein
MTKKKKRSHHKQVAAIVISLPPVEEKKAVVLVPLGVEKGALENLADKIFGWLKRASYE